MRSGGGFRLGGWKLYRGMQGYLDHPWKWQQGRIRPRGGPRQVLNPYGRAYEPSRHLRIKTLVLQGRSVAVFGDAEHRQQKLQLSVLLTREKNAVVGCSKEGRRYE